MILSIVWGIYYKERPDSSWPTSVLDPEADTVRLLSGYEF